MQGAQKAKRRTVFALVVWYSFSAESVLATMLQVPSLLAEEDTSAATRSTCISRMA